MVRVVMTVPVTAGSPWIIDIISIIVTIIIASAIIIPVVQLRPAIAVRDAHTEIAVIVILAGFAILVILLLFYTGVFILGAGRGKINVIGSLTCFVSGGATAECGYSECQE